MEKNRTNDMTVGSPVKLIIQFMIPMFLGNIFQQFYNIVDSIVAGQFIGVDALAAIGSTGSLMFFVTGWLNGLSSGFAIIVAQMFGAKRYDDMRHFVAMSIYLISGIQCPDPEIDEFAGRSDGGCGRLYGDYLCRTSGNSGIQYAGCLFAGTGRFQITVIFSYHLGRNQCCS